MTNTVSLVLTGAGSVIGSGPELAGQGPRVMGLGAVTAAGGAAGAGVLLATPASTFEVVVPVLIAGASLLLLLQPRIGRLRPDPYGGHMIRGIALFAVAMYVGYFGAAGGVMLLVVLSAIIDETLVKVNAVKNAVSGMANAMAAGAFALFGDVRWALAVPLACGFGVGGWMGPKIARRVPAGAFRAVVGLCGIGLAVRLGISAYR
jgi:uncharacterized membrane protein YfcA